MLKQFFLSSTLMISAVGAGFAADLPAYPAPAMYDPIPVYNWTGFYVGGLIGGVHAKFTNSSTNAGPGGDAGGFTIGATAGYNHQLNPSWAVGIETDVSYQDIEAKSSGVGSFEEDWMGTLRLRGGYTFSRYFVYATAGVALTSRDAKVVGFGSGDDSVFGFTGGVGVEGKFNDRWSAKLEYLYVDVPKDRFKAGGINVVGGSNNHVGRIGLNYHF